MKDKVLAYLKSERSELTRRYYGLYGDGDYAERAELHQRKLLKNMLLVLVMILVLVPITILKDNSASLKFGVDDSGNVLTIERPSIEDGAQVIEFQINAKSENGTYTSINSVEIEPVGGEHVGNETTFEKGESESNKLQRKIENAIRSLNDDTNSEILTLPIELEDGIQLEWTKSHSRRWPLVMLVGIVILIALYRSRYDQIKKEEKIAKESIIKELPVFLNKLVLLLSAGVVLSAAFSKCIDEISIVNKEENYLISQFKLISDKSKETNSPVHEELLKFAKRSNVRELLRFSNVVNDNVNKGSELCRKLEEECNEMWFVRKKYAEEKGRLAETKLTLPLVILLLVLVMITIAPALMDI